MLNCWSLTSKFFPTEIDQCVLIQIISDPSITSGMCEQAAVRLSAIQDHFFYRKVQVVSLLQFSLPQTNILNTTCEPDNVVPNNTPTKPVKTEDHERVETDEPMKTENSFMAKVRNMIDEKKEWYEERKRKTASNAVDGTNSNSIHEPHKADVKMLMNGSDKGHTSEDEISSSEELNKETIVSNHFTIDG